MKHCSCLVLAAMLLAFPGLAHAYQTGDLNCDGAINVFDIDPFVLALVDPAGYAAEYPDCDFTLADANHDGDVNVFDIDPFVQLLVGGPSTAACCYPAGSCAVTTEADCDGVWHPEWADCTEAACPQPAPPTAIELAGNALTAYPYFEFVRAFHQSAPIQVALDASRHPEITFPVTADVYICEKKSSGEWGFNPELDDVTSDGPLTVTFPGGTIQANTFQVTGPGELSAAVYQEVTGAYTGLGHGYDMIIDMNQNGVLDAGDFIDGYGREAGLYVCHDTTTGGPLPVTELLYSVGSIFGIPASLPNENIYYPTNIASMGQLPLIVISHGNGHNYQWYDHIGNHMASYGFVVMSHGNNTGPGPASAAYTTCGHTDAFLHLLSGIAGGVMVGHVDTSRIIWIGHSRGGEGVAIAYHYITHGSYNPTYYSPESIVLVDSMLPIDATGPGLANPHEVNYHLWTAAGDSDVHGGASSDGAQTFHIHERATRFRGSTVVQGTGHGWFHDSEGSGAWFTGPCPINESGTHLVQLGIMLPMYKHYAEGNVPGEDYLWRQYERFHPPSVPVGTDPCYVVSQEYRNMGDDGYAFIDDYETQTGTGTSSSGGSVTYDVTNLTEGRLDDNNSDFSWTASDPFNGATQDGASDTGKGVVFDWNGTNRYYEWSVVPELRNFAAWKYLGLRGAQGTQHPYTQATNGILTFTITLRDGANNTSSINTGAYGGGFGMPYARSGGWHNEMRRIRIRTTDFLANGSPLDLGNIVAVRLNFGPAWGTNQGRIVIDELMLDNDLPPFFVPLTMSLAGPALEFIPPYVPTAIDVEIDEGNDTLLPGSAVMYYRNGAGSWIASSLQQVAGSLWRGVLPAPVCGDRPEYYFVAEGDITGEVYVPATGAAAPFASLVGTFTGILDDNFQSDLGWTVSSAAGMVSGMWTRAVPGGWDDGSPRSDFDGSGRCYVTDNRSGYDVDGGPTHLISPLLDLTGTTDPVVRYAEWITCDDPPPGMDYLDVYLSDDGGVTWIQVDHISPHDDWVVHNIHVADFVSLTATFQVRFTVQDVPNNSFTEAGIDAVTVFDVNCE